MQRLLCLCIAVALSAAPLSTQAARERAVYTPRPQYPPEAKAHHLTGSGAFALHIRADGTVERIETLKSIGHLILDQAAIAAFQRWRFSSKTTTWIIRIPIGYVDGPPRVDVAMSQPPAPGWGVLISVFSGRHE